MVQMLANTTMVVVVIVSTIVSPKHDTNLDMHEVQNMPNLKSAKSLGSQLELGNFLHQWLGI